MKLQIRESDSDLSNWLEDERKAEYAREEEFDKLQQWKEDFGVWSYVTLFTDGHELYGVVDYEKLVKERNYDSSEYEGIVEYGFGSYDEYDDEYIDWLMEETTNMLKPYIMRLYEDVKSGKYQGYWQFNFTYTTYAEWADYEPATPDYPGNSGTFSWEPNQGEVTEEKKRISEDTFQDKIYDWSIGIINDNSF